MTIQEIKEMVAGPQYDFLRTDPHLQGRTMFLCLGGSYAYGTNMEGSDVDIRGCALNSPSDLLGLSNFEQVRSDELDVTVYSFSKLVPLLINCNPNIIEMLGCKPEHYFMMTDIGQKLIDNRKLFLSRQAIGSFGGYATQQLRRLENALAHDKMPQARQEEYIRQSMLRAMRTFGDKYTDFGNGSIRLRVEDSDKPELDKEVVADINLSGYPVREFNSIMNELRNVVCDFDKLNKRNNKKDDAHLNKHAMHLIRLYLMCLDILERGEIITYREKEHDLLMSIRSGVYQNEDGTFAPEFFELVNDFERRMKYAGDNTDLPEHPDMKKVEELMMEINREALK